MEINGFGLKKAREVSNAAASLTSVFFCINEKDESGCWASMYFGWREAYLWGATNNVILVKHLDRFEEAWEAPSTAHASQSYKPYYET